jgi:hypothetical protein
MALEPEPEPELDEEGNPVEPPEPEPEPEPELDADGNPIVPVPDPELSELFPNVPLASAVFDLSMLTLPAPEISSTLPNLAGVPFAWRWPACPSPAGPPRWRPWRRRRGWRSYTPTSWSRRPWRKLRRGTRRRRLESPRCSRRRGRRLWKMRMRRGPTTWAPRPRTHPWRTHPTEDAPVEDAPAEDAPEGEPAEESRGGPGADVQRAELLPRCS